ALGVIRELQKRYPIKRVSIRLRLIIPEENSCSLMNAWNAEISLVESGNQLSLLSLRFLDFEECNFITKRLFNCSGTGHPDSTIERGLLNMMRAKCTDQGAFIHLKNEGAPELARARKHGYYRSNASFCENFGGRRSSMVFESP
ncbi:hypothetical protein MKX01_007791, partial [Papaver californicum]